MKEMSDYEYRLLKERIIREYQMEQEQKYPSKKMEVLIQKLVKITPINIVLGIVACSALIYFYDWKELLKLLLTGVVYITLISSVVANMVKR